MPKTTSKKSAAKAYKNLVIVESPAKARTIEKYLGADFHVLSSVGHIRSIAKKAKDGNDAIDTAHDFATTYEIDPEKKKTVAELRAAVKNASTIWLATDEDREGEAIAWHLCEVLKLDPAKTNRIVFHEITKSAIENAVKNPRTIDMDLVRAQQARQILDRLVGFELSPVVWQKVPGGKSAGRVQSPAVRLLVEREREIDAFASSFSFKVTAEFYTDKDEKAVFKAELPQKFATEAEAHDFLNSLLGAAFSVASIETSPGSRNPGPPYTTSTLQQDANSRLGFSARTTMSSAQKLYQAGKITYMRTDSVNLSKQALAQASEYITNDFGKEYHQFRTFKTKAAGAQEAHEAIRPTNISAVSASSDSRDQKLYDLIRRRTLASQMAPAKLEKTTVKIAISTSKDMFEAKGEVVLFDGFLKVYGSGPKDDARLPKLASNDELKMKDALAKQIFAKPPARYTEGSLVKKLEDLGIGRPSTYATIIGTIQDRGYVAKGENEGEPRDVITLKLANDSVERKIIQEKSGSDKGKLVPTASGQVVSDFLTGHFDQIVDYDFTARVENELDEIADAELDRNKMLRDFYTPFHKLIEQSGDIKRSEVSQARAVGVEPKSGKTIYARFGRFGPMLQLGESASKAERGDKDEKPTFAPMPRGAKVETVTLEQALKAFELPRAVGQTPDGKDIIANIGRFGPYIKVGDLFVSIKPHDPHDISLADSIELYEAKLKAEAEKNIADFGDGVKVLNGRWGPYVTDGAKNAKIPKDVDPKSITHEQAVEMIANAPAAKGRFARRKTASGGKKVAGKKTTARKTARKKSAKK